MRKPWIACVALAVLPWQVQAQEHPWRVLLETGIVGGNSAACPGHYVGINGRFGRPVPLYGMVENYRCADLAGSRPTGWERRCCWDVPDRWCDQRCVRALSMTAATFRQPPVRV